MLQFEEALRADDPAILSDFNEAPNSPVVGPQRFGTPSFGQRVRKVSALSDFAPVNLKVKRCVCMYHCLFPTVLRHACEDGDDHPDRRTRAASGSTSHYDGHYSYGFVRLLVCANVLTIRQGSYISVHRGAVQHVRSNSTISECEGMDIGVYAYSLPLNEWHTDSPC